MSIMSSQVLVVLFVVTSTVVIAQKNSDFCFPFSNIRPDGNLIIPNIRVEGVPMSRHHIIPLPTLQRFFEIALTNNPDTCRQMSDFLNKVLEILFSAVPLGSDGINSTEIVTRNNLRTENNLIWRLVTGSNAARTALMRGNRTPFTVSRAVAAYFAWFPSNIFVGPTSRSDDPGSNFETSSRYIVGEVAYSALRQANTAMNYVISNGRNVNIYAIMEALDSLAELHDARDQAYPFMAANWIKDPVTGKWRIRQQPSEDPRIHEELRRRRNGGSSEIMCSFDHIFNRVLEACREEFKNHLTTTCFV